MVTFGHSPAGRCCSASPQPFSATPACSRSFTYIAPLLTTRSGFEPAAAISPILLLFGGGLVLGNLAGGRIADRALMAAVFGSLALLLDRAGH